jgi:outer membrane murein-binding lipoprotein Lpp
MAVMAELKLLYSDRSLLLHGSAWIALAGGYSQDKDGTIFLTPECSSVEELSHYIDGFKHDLERARNQAKAAFEAAKDKPPRDPFLD